MSFVGSSCPPAVWPLLQRLGLIFGVFCVQAHEGPGRSALPGRDWRAPRSGAAHGVRSTEAAPEGDAGKVGTAPHDSLAGCAFMAGAEASLSCRSPAAKSYFRSMPCLVLRSGADADAAGQTVAVLLWELPYDAQTHQQILDTVSVADLVHMIGSGDSLIYGNVAAEVCHPCVA